MLEYLNRFGSGSANWCRSSGRNFSRLRPGSQWVDIDLATASFGPGIARDPTANGQSQRPA